MLRLFTVDPRWIRPQYVEAKEMLFYDGSCGLCHRFVRFVLAEEPVGLNLRFAPIGGETFRAAVPESTRRTLPDSLVLLAADGSVVTRSAACIHLMRRLGGVWRVLAEVMSLVPARIRDRVYDRIANIRSRLFPRPAEVCPILPVHLRERFDT